MTKNRRMPAQSSQVVEGEAPTSRRAQDKSKSKLPIRILSHNIRYATRNPFRGEELWPVRAPRLLNELRHATLYNQESFIGLQEVLNVQLVDILNGLNDASDSENEWDYIGVGREDGKQGGEYSPILYRPQVWQLQDFKTIWLSETPDRPSKSWDAASTRILTIGSFKHVESGVNVTVMSTHLDDQGSKSRYEGAKIIINCIEDASPQPVLLAGDFNSEPGQEAYQVLSNTKSPVFDLKDRVAKSNRYGHENTFTGFGHDRLKRIDFLFCSKESDWDVKGYAVLENVFDDGVYNSDHRAVVGDVVLAIES